MYIQGVVRIWIKRNALIPFRIRIRIRQEYL